MNILLCCSAGMSTSLLVEKMKKAAQNMDVKAKIWAVPASEVNKHIGDADVLLIGPQIRFKLAYFKKEVEAYNIPVEVIDSVDYGTLNGENVLKTAIELIENDKKRKEDISFE